MTIETGYKVVKWIIISFQWTLIAFVIAVVSFFLWILWTLFFSGPPMTLVPG
jgi:hypothetical protein